MKKETNDLMSKVFLNTTSKLVLGEKRLFGFLIPAGLALWRIISTAVAAGSLIYDGIKFARKVRKHKKKIKKLKKKFLGKSRFLILKLSLYFIVLMDHTFLLDLNRLLLLCLV